MGMTEKSIDLRGLKCPLPALKTRKALSGLAVGEVIAVTCTDPLSAIDIPNLLREAGDITRQNYSDADLVTVYLLPSSNVKIRPMLEKQLKKGARVVSHDFEFTGWTPVKTEHIEDDGEGRSHTLYLYVR